LARYDVEKDKWEKLWDIEGWFSNDCKPLLSPDEKYLWMMGDYGVFVGNLLTKQHKLISFEAVGDIGEAKMVRFDARHGAALIAYPRGLVCTDYSGKVKKVINTFAELDAEKK
jgi:hypothetical protein